MDNQDSENVIENSQVSVQVQVHNEVSQTAIPENEAIELAKISNANETRLDSQFLDEKGDVLNNINITEVLESVANNESTIELQKDKVETDGSEKTSEVQVSTNDVQIEVPEINSSEKEATQRRESQSLSRKSTEEKLAKISSKAQKIWLYSRRLTIASITILVVIALGCLGYALFHVSDSNYSKIDNCIDYFCIDSSTQKTPVTTKSQSGDDEDEDKTTTTETTTVITQSLWDTHIENSFYTSIGTDFLAIIFEKPTTFNEMKRLCDTPKDQTHTSTYWPVFNFTTFNVLASFGKAIQKHENEILEPHADQVLIWTGAYIDVADPDVVKLSNGDIIDESLENFENDLCPESRNYTAIINADIDKINRLAEADVPFIGMIVARPQRIHVTLQYNRNGSLCLQLYDRDVGSKSEDEDSHLLPACQMRSTGHAHALPYFPRIIERNVNFDDAKSYCSPIHNYTYDLIGLEQANQMFLSRTSEIVGKIQGFGVWVGGYFDVKSQQPYFVSWADGRISDSLKSPDEIWCRGKHPRDVIARIIQKNNDIAIVHIVRLKNQSDCLIPYDEDTSKHVFYPMCVTRPKQFFLKLGNKVMVPPLYDQLFDKDTLSIVGFTQRYETLPVKVQNSLTIVTHDDLTKVPNMPPTMALSAIPIVLAGFKELVTRDYAEMLCRHVHYDIGSPNGMLLTDNVFNQLPFNEYFSHVISILREKLLPLPLNSSLTTGVRFDFLNNYSQLMYYDDERSWPGTLNTQLFPWCDNVDAAVELQNRHREFMQWYTLGAGNKTTGPHYVYLAAEPGLNTTCMRLVVKDLYWPGAHQWAPFCQLERPGV